MKRVGSIVVFAVVMSLTMACNLLSLFGIASAPLPGSGTDPLMTVEYTGGLCVYGACSAVYTVSADGTISLVRGDGLSGSDHLNSEELTALTGVIASADYDALRSVPFTDICPPAYDGSQVIYTFYTSAGTQVIDACEFVVDENAPLFQTVRQILEQYSSLTG